MTWFNLRDQLINIHLTLLGRCPPRSRPQPGIHGAKTESFGKREYIENSLTNLALGIGAVIVLPGLPWIEWAFYGLAAFILVALLEIRGKLEAIRFMMAHEFGKKNGLDP